MTNSVQVRILILSKEVRYRFGILMNLVKSREPQLFPVILQTSHDQTLICLQFSENVCHTSKFKAHPRDIFFLWIFFLLWINPSRYLIEKLVYVINTWWRENMDKLFHLFRYWRILCFFNVDWKIPYQQFLILLSSIKES